MDLAHIARLRNACSAVLTTAAGSLPGTGCDASNGELISTPSLPSWTPAVSPN